MPDLVIVTFNKHKRLNKKVKEPKTLEKSAPFVEMYDQYADAIYRFALFKVSDRELAWDIAQECFLKMWRQMENEEKEIRNQKALLFTIARHLIIDHWRQKAKHKTIDMEEVAFTLGDDKDLHRQSIIKEETEVMMRQLDKLPTHQKEILVLRYTEDLPFYDIAKITGKSLISVRVEAHRAIKKLKLLMGKK